MACKYSVSSKYFFSGKNPLSALMSGAESEFFSHPTLCAYYKSKPSESAVRKAPDGNYYKKCPCGGNEKSKECKVFMNLF